MFIFVIREIREKRDMSINELAVMSNISYIYMWELENNKKQNPSMDVLERIAKALNVNIKEIFYADSEIEGIRKRLHYHINKYGLHHPKTLNLSHLLDILINIKNDISIAQNNSTN